ncbi:MAG TPA: hypothetical protein VMM36_08825, partial [Opitutaceae bacterium]|nr:hypothetical protein [Opitutaceae bacterium]
MTHPHPPPPRAPAVALFFVRRLRRALWCAAIPFFATAGTAATLADFGHENMTVNGKAALGVRPAVIILLDLANSGTFSHPSSYYGEYVFNPSNTTTAGVRSANGFLLANSHGRFSIAPAGVGIVGPVQLSDSDRMAALGDDVKKAGLAINAAALAGFNFAPFDSDGNGRVTTDELLILIFDNSSTEDSGAARAANPTGLNPDTTFNAFTPPGSSVSMLVHTVILTQNVSFATLCHELIHLLGAKDLYGIWGQKTCYGGKYTVMSCTILEPADLATQEFNTFHLDAWHKMQLGWVEPRIREISASVVETITAAQSPTATDAPVILYDPAHGTDEFFLLEYRTNQINTGSLGYEDDLPSNGLCIWHVVHDGNKNLIEWENIGQSVWLAGQPLLGRGQDSRMAWTSATITPP